MLSGQCATGANGIPQHKDDMAAQLKLAVANLGEVLKQAGMDYTNVTGIRVYTTDMDATLANWESLIAPSAPPAIPRLARLSASPVFFHPTCWLRSKPWPVREGSSR